MKTEDEARSYCYRDHIYVAHAYGVNKTHTSQTPGVSSLLVIEGKEDPLDYFVQQKVLLTSNGMLETN